MPHIIELWHNLNEHVILSLHCTAVVKDSRVLIRCSANVDLEYENINIIELDFYITMCRVMMLSVTLPKSPKQHYFLYISDIINQPQPLFLCLCLGPFAWFLVMEPGCCIWIGLDNIYSLNNILFIFFFICITFPVWNNHFSNLLN